MTAIDLIEKKGLLLICAMFKKKGSLVGGHDRILKYSEEANN